MIKFLVTVHGGGLAGTRPAKRDVFSLGLAASPPAPVKKEDSREPDGPRSPRWGNPPERLQFLLMVCMLVTAGFCLTTCGAAHGVEPALETIPTLAADARPDYTTHVAPIMAQSCVSCHSGLFPAGGYAMTSYDALMTSGKHYPNIRAGDPSSNLLRMLHGERISAGGPMPPAQPLTPAQIALIEHWILAGAHETTEIGHYDR